MLPRLPSLRSSLLRLHDTVIRIQEMSHLVSKDEQLTLLEQATILLEDKRFFSHQGYDWRSIVRELAKAVRGQRFGGASTIDIQLFRTMSNRYERSARRKFRELIGARALQKKCSKVDILRSYLQNAYFGTGLIGCESASFEMFGKSSSDLNIDEATFIASMLVYPKPRLGSANWQAKVSRRAKYGRFLFWSSEKSSKQIPR